MLIKRDVTIFGSTPWIWSPSTVLSTGRSGIDAAALDTAIAMGISFEGFTSKTHKFGNDTVRRSFNLPRLDTDNYEEVVRYTREHSDAEVCLHSSEGPTVSDSTVPLINIEFRRFDTEVIVRFIEVFLETFRPQRLFVHGTSESMEAGITDVSREIIARALSCCVPLEKLSQPAPSSNKTITYG